MASVYIETSVPSAFVSARTDAGSVHRRQATRDWWSDQLGRYEVFISDIVQLELEDGDWPGENQALRLIAPLGRLDVDQDVYAVAQRYVVEKVVPAGLSGDAAHPVACVHEIDFLLTWNIRHLANPNKTEHLTVINRRLGLLTPQIVTPDMLWLEDAE